MFDAEYFNNLSYDEKMERLAQVAHLFTEEQLESLCTKWKLERDIEQSKDMVRRLTKEKERIDAGNRMLSRIIDNDREAQLLWQMRQK